MARLELPLDDVRVAKDLTVYKVELVVWEVTIPAGESYNTGCEYGVSYQFDIDSFDDEDEAGLYTEALGNEINRENPVERRYAEILRLKEGP